MNFKLNKSDYTLIAIYYIVSIILNIYEYIERENDLIEFLIDIPTSVIISIITIYLFVLKLIPNFLIKEKKYLHFIAYALLILSVLGMIEITVGFWSGSNDWAKFPNWHNLMVEGIYMMSNDNGFLLGILLTKKFYESQKQIISFEKQQKENELKLLRSQIDPHFLFNNLNTLDSLIDSNPEKAKEYINRLSLIYRYLIQTKDSEVMELSEEIKLAENYIFLIETRFGNDYSFRIEEDTAIIDTFIPTGAVQVLLENVVKHNKKEKTSIKTTITINETYLQITNTKSTIKAKNESFGTGLENLKARYKHLSNKEVVIEDKEKEFKVLIPIINLSE